MYGLYSTMVLLKLLTETSGGHTLHFLCPARIGRERGKGREGRGERRRRVEESS
jgi:hypothetical protein